MKKTIYLSLACIALLHANEDLGEISVTKEGTTQVVHDISGEEIKSADLAEALNNNVPSISLIRRSGIANDVTLRGQKRDNINVTIDGAKICGACVNRMDPPTSHVVTHAIEDIEVQEGPFDVEEFGALSGSIKIKTKKPSKKLSGDISLNTGSFGYQKASGSISGGSNKVKVLFTASTEKGEQYKDGNGDNFAEQLQKYTASTSSTEDDQFNYAPQHQNMDAFEKTMLMGKVFIDITDDQALQLGYTANRSKNVLYPSSKMDADYDDSDIFNLEYSLKNLSPYSKALKLQVYNSKVDHPMSTKYRVKGQTRYMTHQLSTEMTGIKLKNSVDAFNQNISYGIDRSKRNWDGEYTVTTVDGSAPLRVIGKSIDDVDTENMAFFIKGKKSIEKIDIEWGVRYDDTHIDTTSSTEKDNSYQALSGNIFLNYQNDDTTKYFVGLGKSSRVPDARELYNVKYNTTVTPNRRVLNGNPNLDQTKNYEIDLGVEKEFDNGSLKVKTFYSKLEDYIYYNGSLNNNNFENINATIYGAELSGMYMIGDSVTFDAGLAYKKGKKDTQTTNQTNTDLADISPLKLNATLSYDYDDQGDIELSVIARDKWSNYDEENGEQALDEYAILNLKSTREFDNGLILTAGVDNLLDKNYATTNTYKDLILMTDNSDTMLINEPGRYLYLNAKYQF